MLVSEIRDGAFREDADLRLEVMKLVQPSYEDPAAVLEREFEHCDTIYLARDDEDNLAAFFMVAWETMSFKGEALPTVYLGWTGASELARASRVVWRDFYEQLYGSFISDAINWERESGRRLLFWGTTATPSGYYALQRGFVELEPRIDGKYSAEGAEIARLLRRRMGVTNQESESNPFVLRGVAADTRYSAEEAERIEMICRKKGFTLFKELGVEERDGDRLLFICRLPQSDG
jgi:hypothetical protein